MKPYPAYKDSGLQWLGPIPEHWNTAQVRRNCRVFSGGTPDRSQPLFWENGSIPWLSSGEVNQRRIVKANQFISPLGLANSSAKWLPARSVVIALAGQGKTKAMVATLEFEATCNQSLAAVVPDAKKMSYSFLAYSLEVQYSRIRGLVGDDLRDGLNLEIVKSLVTCFPSPAEQSAIVAFLARKCADIDRFLDRKRRLIALLKEQKAAIITQAVTQGLNPDAPRKASGVEWLGNVPEHWEILNLGKIVRFVKTGSTPSSLEEDYFSEGEIDWFTPGDFKSSINLRNSERKLTSNAIKNREVRYFDANTVFLVGIGATLGKVGILGYSACCNQQITAIGFSDANFPVYGVYFLRSAKEALTNLAQYTTMPILNQSDTKKLRFLQPPLDEQKAIVEHIETESRKIDAAIGRIEREMELMHEYRTALISEAVTGKIDVRESAGRRAEADGPTESRVFASQHAA
ncbi:MAG: restriction endonuclease subunit S [Acidimicrobiales bacterium]